MAANIVRNGVADANTKSKGCVGVVIAVFVIIAIVMVVKALYDAIKNGGLTLGSQIGKTIIAAQTGIAPARQSVCEDVAKNIAKDGYTVYPIIDRIWDVKEVVMIRELNRLVTPAEAVYADVIFKTQSAHPLSWLLNNSNFTGKANIKTDILTALI